MANLRDSWGKLECIWVLHSPKLWQASRILNYTQASLVTKSEFFCPKKYTCFDCETRVHPTKIHQLVCFPSFIISGVNLRAFGNPKKAQAVWLRHLQPTYALPWMNWELSLLWGVKTNQLSGICGLGKLWFPKFLAHVFDVNGKLTNQQKIEFSEGYLE